MKIWTFPVAMAAFAMAASPALAQASQNAPVSNTVSRAAAAVDEESNANRGSGVILGVLAAAAIIGGIVIAAGNKDDTPASP